MKARRSNLLWMLASISLLIVIGLENILSSTFVLDEGASLSGYLIKQLGFLGGGIAAAWVIWRLGYQFIRRWCSKIVLINIICLIAVKFVGITVNGARRWLGFGAFFVSAVGVCQVSGDHHDGRGHCLLFGTTWK